MPNKYFSIEGWFDFADVYNEMVEKFRDGGRFVEVGCWLGCSSVYLLERIIETEANIKVDFIDTWMGDPDVEYQQRRIQEMTPEGFYNQFVSNITSVDPELKHCNIIKANSLDAVAQYDNESLDFVYLDDSHYYEQIATEIPEWLDKVKVGGFLGGHDYEQAHVSKAVHEALGVLPGRNHTWLYQKVQ